MKNQLYYGDNLDVLRESIDPESVDLVYLDPPFNSNRSYNVLFQSRTGHEAEAQIHAFGDTWTWSQPTEKEYENLIQGGAPAKVADAIQAMYGLLGENDLLAYLVMMTPRLVELHRVLKPTGSLYLHCDSTASHYLRVMLDAVFGAMNFRNEIIWKRAQTVKGNFGQGSKFFGPQTDTLLFYKKSTDCTFHQPFKPYTQDYMDGAYRHVEAETGRRYRLVSMIGPGGAAKGNPEYEVMGIRKYWRYSREKMNELIAAGLVVQTKPGTVPNRKYYLDEGKGVPVQSLWDDLNSLQASSAERLGYPTQKPLALLERIIETSSNPGDLVLDPFCGCGTAIDAAQRLDRRWIGIDITFIAIDLIEHRLANTFGSEVSDTYEVHGIPQDLAGARQLFTESHFDFERWAVSRVSGTPKDAPGGDKGIDGIVRFHADAKQVGRAVVSVKGGKTVNPGFVRDLDGTITHAKAEMGILVLAYDPTPGMLDAVRHSGTYTLPANGQEFPRLQIITVEQLINGEKPKMPLIYPPYLKAQPHSPTTQETLDV
jgi:DNA modification methylase